MDGYPSSRTSLLHQKLQMLNVCIDRKKRRDAAVNEVVESDSESDEEFYDCNEEYFELNKKKCKPQGRLEKFGNLKLLQTGEPIYVPLTQEPVPKTEDELEQYGDVIHNSGMNPEACLLSDMQSFKAANPDSIFDDFIRWYSPKDWIVEEELDEFGQKKGHLSTRMVIPDNIWLQLWQSANMVPANRQKRLFDDTIEGYKTLNYLESRKISDIVHLLLPSLTHAVLFKLGEECKDKNGLNQLEGAFKRAVSDAVKLTRDKAEPELYKNLAEQISNIELLIARWKSLKMKFENSDEVGEFLSKLIKGEEAEVIGGGTGNLGVSITKMFKEAKKDGRDTPENIASSISSDNPFGNADEKEFVLRVMARRPASLSRSSPQMMRAIFKGNEFRILGAFTEDVIFT